MLDNVELVQTLEDTKTKAVEVYFSELFFSVLESQILFCDNEIEIILWKLSCQNSTGKTQQLKNYLQAIYIAYKWLDFSSDP